MVHIAICDDNDHIVQFIYDIVYDKFRSLKIPFKIVKCSNGEDLLYQIKEVGDFDLVFLDIELGVDNGIDTAAKIKESNPCCYVVFISGYEKYYKAAFSVQPYQFLDKPIKKEDMERIIETVSKKLINDDQVFAFEYGRKQYRINLREILYFVSDLRKIMICTKDGAVYYFYGKMNDVENELKNMSIAFMRIHQSYIINMNYIKVLQKKNIVMQDDSLFPISSSRWKQVMEQYMYFVMGE